MAITNLVGGVAQFQGDVDEPVFVSTGTIAANCVDGDTDVPKFLAAVVGDACTGYYTSKQKAIDDSNAAYQAILNPGSGVTPCTWLALYGPLAFKNDFVVANYTEVPDQGMYLVTADWLQQTSIRTGGGQYLCWDTVKFYGSVIQPGFEPKEVVSPMHPEACLLPGQTSQVTTTHGGSGYSGPNGETYIRSGTLLWTKLGPLLSVNGGYSVVNGEISMPIPPIPEGYSTPPPLLVGGVDSNIDDYPDWLCQEIVQKGGGFQNITDVANNYQENPWELQQDYHRRTDVPTYLTIDIFEYLLTQTDPAIIAQILPVVPGDGQPLSLQAMVNAFNDAPPMVQTAFLVSTFQQMAPLDIWEAFALGGNETILRETSKIILKEVAEAPLLEPTVVVDDLIETSTMVAERTPTGAIALTLTLAEKELKNKTVTGLVTVNDCVKDVAFEVVSLDESPKVQLPGSIQYNNLAFFQWLADSLQMLKRCCNPCVETHEQEPFLEYFWGKQCPPNPPEPRRLSTSDFSNVDRVTFSVIRNLLPRVYEFGTPDLSLYAKVSWFNSAGQYGPIHYVNIDQATIYPDIEDVAGVMVHCYNGVELAMQRFFKAANRYPHDYYDGQLNPSLNP